jgi:DnaJ-class molecular chaperone
MKDLYKILGVPHDAESVVIKSAYRRLARELHPDATGGDRPKTERFKEVCAAYAILADDGRRREYDQEQRARPAFTETGSVFGPLFDDLVVRVSEQGVNSGNVDDLLKQFIEMTVDVRDNLPKRAAAATQTAGGFVEMIEQIFGTHVEVGGKTRVRPDVPSGKKSRSR